MIELLAELTTAADRHRAGRDRCRKRLQSASIPLALDRLLLDGSELGGRPALLIGFGAGLNYATQVVTLP